MELCMKKELPIVIEGNYVKTECWSFERLSIIQTSDKGNAWIASHFELFLDGYFNAHFGSLFKWYHSNYYDDILSTEKIDFLKIRKEDIVDKIKELLDEGLYVFLVTNWNLEKSSEPLFHGMIIFGYDDEQRCFRAPVMNEYKVWISGKVSYEKIIESHDDVVKFFKEKNNRLMFTIDYQFPMLAYKIREDYSTDQCVYMALEKIEKEFNGRICWNVEGCAEMQLKEGEMYYTGLSCLFGLEKLLNIFIQNKKCDRSYDLTNTVSQLYEHRKMLIVSMEYICQQWKILDREVIDCINKYKKSCDEFYSWYHIAVKYELCKDKSLLYEMLEEIHRVYSLEKEALSDFYKIVKQRYRESDSI